MHTWKETVEWEFSGAEDVHYIPTTVELFRDEYGCQAQVVSAPFGALNMTRATLVSAFGYSQVEALESYCRNLADEMQPPVRNMVAEEARAYRMAV